MSHTSECTLHAYLFKILFSTDVHILRHTLELMSGSFSPVGVSFSHSWPMNTRCLSFFHPLLCSRFSHKQYITVILSSSRSSSSEAHIAPSVSSYPTYSCGRMLFHFHFAARNSSKRRYSLWEHTSNARLVSVTKCWG